MSLCYPEKFHIYPRAFPYPPVNAGEQMAIQSDNLPWKHILESCLTKFGT
jgi:hypothetical protein